jgi:uroporphyrinogen decarboxylase
VPVINFSQGVSAYFCDAVEGKGDAVSVDWRMPLMWYWEQIGYRKPIQGNLDPVLFLAPWEELKFHIDTLLSSVGSRPGHIFNLGHGILPETDPLLVAQAVQYIHEESARIRAQ